MKINFFIKKMFQNYFCKTAKVYRFIFLIKQKNLKFLIFLEKLNENTCF